MFYNNDDKLKLNRQEIGLCAAAGFIFLMVLFRTLNNTRNSFVIKVTGISVFGFALGILNGVLLNWIEFGKKEKETTIR